MSTVYVEKNQPDADALMIRNYIHTSAVVAGTPIDTAHGPLIPIVSVDANVETTYYTRGRFKANIQAAETVSQGATVYYDTATNKVTASVPAAGFVLGRATLAGTGTAGTVVFDLATDQADRTISLEHLDSGIRPSYITIAAGEATTAGSDAREEITISGLLPSDIAMVAVKTPGSSPVTVLSFDPTTTTLVVTLSGDPSTDHVLAYQIVRAAS